MEDVAGLEKSLYVPYGSVETDFAHTEQMHTWLPGTAGKHMTRTENNNGSHSQFTKIHCAHVKCNQYSHFILKMYISC